MKRWTTKWLMILVLLGLPGLSSAGGHGWIGSIARAVPSDQVYRVNIQQIDGKQRVYARNYRVDAGEHKVRVSLVMEYDFATNLKRITSGQIYVKTLTVDVEDGKRYEIGGQVDPDASDEAQRDGSFWKPVVYRAK